MRIQAVTQKTGVAAQTIRYYESIHVLPAASRLPNGYRDYAERDVERIRFVAGARQLGFSLDDIAEILALRDEDDPPCRAVMRLLREKSAEIKQRIAELQHMEKELRSLYAHGLTFPEQDILGKQCICHLVREKSGQTA